MDLFEYSPPLEKALDAAAMRQQVIANNMTHVNDPNYRGQQVAFEDKMKEAMDKWHNKDGDDALSQEGEVEACALEPEVEASPNHKVDMNQEMANMAKNQILYNGLTGKISGYFSALKYVVDNSGR